MGIRLLQLAIITLIVSSFSFVDRELVVTEAATVTRTHLLFRIIPMVAVVAMCCAALPRHLGAILMQLTRPPMLWWAWFAAVAITSGFLSDVSPLWSAWKCMELLAAVFWAASVVVYAEKSRSHRVVEGVLWAVYATSYLVALWGIGFAATDGIGKYLASERLEVELPLINSITLSIISAMAVAGTWVCFRRTNPLVVVMLIVPPLLTLYMARARTGILGLASAGLALLVSSQLSRTYRLLLVVAAIFVMGLMVSNEGLRRQFRVTDIEEVLKLSGRIESQEGDSAWAECTRLIAKSPILGHGFLNFTRFVYEGRVVGDNGYLHALASAGVVGAVPLFLYVVYLLFSWARIGIWQTQLWNQEQQFLYGFGVTAACLAFVKSLTTNSLTANDYALALFLVSAICLKVFAFDRSDHADSAENEGASLEPC